MTAQHSSRGATVRGKTATVSVLTALTLCSTMGVSAAAQTQQPTTDEQETVSLRTMENLDRGIVAVRSGESEVLVSWRLLGLDPEGIGFIVERSTDGGEFESLTSEALTGGTNFVDTTADLSKENTYRVRPVVDGKKRPPSSVFSLAADSATEPAVRIPLREGGPIKFVWVGDLDGDGSYDYVVDRQTSPQKIEAYKSDGTFLWEMDLGPNSVNQNNIEGGSLTARVSEVSDHVDLEVVSMAT